MEVEIEVKSEKESENGMQDIGKICDVEIKKAENGWMVCYRTKEMKPGMKASDHVEWTMKKFVYTKDQEDKAFEDFKNLKKKEEGNSYY
jgi:hypothetical protein